MRDLNPKTTAALLRKVLRGSFPSVLFSIVTERGSMVSSVRISWTDGPTLAQVRAFTGPFEMGDFNGMTDSYDYNSKVDRHFIVNGETYEAGCRYVFEVRQISAAVANACILQIATFWGGVENLPLAIADPHGSAGYRFTDDADYWRPVRADLDWNHHSWSESVHRCAEDPTEFTRRAV